MNAHLEYLYRDAGNNKKWGDVIFSNQESADLYLLQEQIKKVLIDGEFFIGEKSELPKLSFPNRDSELDHDWYEFHSLTPTIEQKNDRLNRDVLEMLETIKQASVI